MSPRLHVCKICGKRFATAKGVCGHQRLHSGSQRIGGLKEESRVCPVSAPAKETETIDLSRMGLRFMTDIEQHEVIEGALNLFMLSQGVYDFAAIKNLPSRDDFMKSMREKNLHCVESKLDDFNDVGKGLPCHLGSSKLQKKTHSSYECNICGKSFVCSQALGSHQRLHRSIKRQSAHKKEYAKALSDSSEAKKTTVSQSPNFEISQEEKIFHCDKKIVSQTSSFEATQEEILCDKKIVSQPTSLEISQAEKFLHCDRENIVSQPPSLVVSEDEKSLRSVELKPDFTKLLAHSGFEESSCSKIKSSALHSPLKNKSHPSYRFKICGKIFRPSQAQGGHQPLHRSIKGQLTHTEDGKTDSEATKIVSKSSTF